jgi:hypothetical protein
MQWKADIEAKLSQLTAQSIALANQLKAQPSINDLLNAISAQLSRMDQGLREDFVGKFAGHIMPATDAITNRVVKLEERLSTAEEQEQKIERQMLAHQTTISEQLDETKKKQLEILNWFIAALNQHHQINADTLAGQKAAAKDCRAAATATAKAASLCTTFAENYENTASHATGAIRTLTAMMQTELRSLVQDIEEKASETIMPIMTKAREMTEKQFLRRTRWLAVGAVIILAVGVFFTKFSQPSPYIMRDAANWRTFESDLTQEQADKINKVINEINAEQRAEEEKKNK